MSCHITLPYQWVECSNGKECSSLIHAEGNENVLNALPFEWVTELVDVGEFSCSDADGMWKVFFTDEEGRPHRVNAPAMEDAVGAFTWFRHGKIHRVDGPAVVTPDGVERWFSDGDFFRAEGSAVEHVDSDGARAWVFGGTLYRFVKPGVKKSDKRSEWIEWRVESAAPDVNGSMVNGITMVELDGATEWFERNAHHRVTSVVKCEGGCSFGWCCPEGGFVGNKRAL